MEEDFDDGWPFGAEGTPWDVLTPSGVCFTEVSKLLARADIDAGEYSFGGRADTLPVAPGLFVNGLGTIPTPLHADHAEKLIALCEKSRFGHNMDTKMDENVRKSWQLEPSLVQFKNPLWKTGIETLSKPIADRLGYGGVPLECVLYKLLVYGEGGHFLKHQDTEKENGMIATLVVQPPSAHEGGDLVVYQDGEVKFRHDFGKSDDTAAFYPQYAVHYADAEHALEEVTKGYRLALVYSICLPPTMRHLKTKKIPRDQSLSEDLAKAISKMDGDDDSFALLLAHEYTENSIRNLGWGALKGADSARYHALDGANAVVSKEKQLLFFIVQLRHDVFYHFDGCDYAKRGHADSITWYTVAGDALGTVSSVKQKINFLNPRQELLNQLWVHFGTMTKEGGYFGNQGSTCMTTYTRCAIVAWQKIKHPEKAMKLMPPSAAAQVLHSIETVNGTLVRQLLEAAANRTAAENTIREYVSDQKKVKLSLEFFRLVCKLLPKAGDSEVVVLFFKNYCPLLGEVKGNEAFIPSLTEIIRAFDWSEIGEAVLASMESKDKKGGLSPMEMALYVLDGQDGGVAQEALLKMTVEKAGAMDDSTLFMSDAIGLLWKWVARSEDKSLFDSIAKKLTNAETSLVGSSIQYLSQYLSASEKEKLAVVRPIVVTRAKWLEDEIKALDKKFTWEMPDASVLQPSEVTTGEGTDETTMIDKIQAFLRGSETSMTTKGVKSFKAFQDAQNFAAVYSREGKNHCSFEMKATKADGEVFVTVTKTRDWFLTQQKQLVQFQAELRLLKEKFEGDFEVNAGDKKRARLSDSYDPSTDTCRIQCFSSTSSKNKNLIFFPFYSS